MLRALLAASLFAPSPARPHTAPQWRFAVAEPAATETGIDPSANPEIVRVICSTGMGTAFKVGPHILLSVAHVTNIGGCAINGVPIKVLHTDGDFAVLYSDEVSDKWLSVDCGGFRRGHLYTAVGYARGLPFQTSVDVIDTGSRLSGFEKLWGVFTVIPGQSGGAMIDPVTRKVVGTINVFDPMRGNSGSVALKDTPVCSRNA